MNLYSFLWYKAVLKPCQDHPYDDQVTTLLPIESKQAFAHALKKIP